jgi:uncharacterized membrane protein (Fun14 family)
LTAAFTQPDGIQDVINDSAAKYNNKPIFHKGELSFGTFLGLCTGYLIKKVGKIFGLFVGTGFVFLQVSKLNGYLRMKFHRAVLVFVSKGVCHCSLGPLRRRV